ncbi:MAG: hypothetical protein LBC76_00690 [Treponema sp.]|nr:hypothetical protein [Treponema sp.]
MGEPLPKTDNSLVNIVLKLYRIVRNQRLIDGGEESLFLNPLKAVIADIHTDNRVVFLFDKTVIVFLAIAASCKRDACIFASDFRRVVDKLRTVIAVKIQDREFYKTFLFQPQSVFVFFKISVYDAELIFLSFSAFLIEATRWVLIIILIDILLLWTKAYPLLQNQIAVIPVTFLVP